MEGYLGGTVLSSLEGTPFEGYGPTEWALEFIARYGGNDGSHHKAWVLDQVARVLCGTPVEVSLHRWRGGTTEYRFRTSASAPRYVEWVAQQEGPIDPATGETEYDHDVGVAP